MHPVMVVSFFLPSVDRILFVGAVRLISGVVTWSASLVFVNLYSLRNVFVLFFGGESRFNTCIFLSFMVNVIQDVCQVANSSPLWYPLKSRHPHHEVVWALLACRKRPALNLKGSRTLCLVAGFPYFCFLQGFRRLGLGPLVSPKRAHTHRRAERWSDMNQKNVIVFVLNLVG